jgi:hypothetical protein
MEMSFYKRSRDMVDLESTSSTHAIGIALKYAVGFIMLAIQLTGMFVLHVAVGAFDLVKEAVKKEKVTVDETPEDLYNYKIDK